MAESPIPQEILVITGRSRPIKAEFEPRRDWRPPRVPDLASVNITDLHGQVNVFIQQLDQVMTETKDKVGGFRLDQFEVTAGIVVEASGGVKLALFANAEAGVAVNAGLKFVFKRPDK